MNIIEIYTRASDGAIRHIFTPTGRGTPEDGTTRVARFDSNAYPIHYNRITNLVQFMRFTSGALVLEDPVLGTSTVADSAWIAAREAEVAAKEAEKTADNDARVDLLIKADAALTQIANDLTAIANGKTAANAATTLAQFRTIILGMLDVQEHTCHREEKVIRVLRAGLRSGWNGT